MIWTSTVAAGVTFAVFGSATYLIWLGLFLGVPILVLAAIGGRVWWRERRALGWTLLGAAGGGWAWDFSAIQLGFWSFNGIHQTGIVFLGLPLEEWLWILGVTALFAGLTLILRPRPAHSVPTDRRSNDAPLPLAPALVLAPFSQFGMLLAAGLVFHSILWARNSTFLRRELPTILRVAIVSILWLLATDPIGAAWGAWTYDPSRVVGVWIFGLIPIEDVFGAVVVSSTAATAVLVFAYSPRRWIW